MDTVTIDRKWYEMLVEFIGPSCIEYMQRNYTHSEEED